MALELLKTSLDRLHQLFTDHQAKRDAQQGEGMGEDSVDVCFLGQCMVWEGRQLDALVTALEAVKGLLSRGVDGL